MEIIIILLLILFNGILSLTETALTASRRLKMETLDKQEKPSTRRALSLMEKPLHSLSAIQIGITLIGICDTNCDPEELDFVIPGNDDAIRAVKLIVSKMADAVVEANQGAASDVASAEAAESAAADAELDAEEA